MAARSPTIIEGFPIERILFVQKMERREAGFAFDHFGLPGHQLNVVEQGRVEIESGGRLHRLERGNVIWYHEAEHSHGRVIEAPWVFYTLNFVAPALPPPNFEHRCLRLPHKDSLDQFAALLESWRDTSVPPVMRVMRVQAALLQILSELITPAQQQIGFGQETSLWWQLEAELRKDLRRSIDMQMLCETTKRSRATITRSCKQAVGVSPLKRIKQIRLSMAHGLVILSKLSISEIADRIGYARVHELSRDYHKQFGMTPTEERERYPKIYQREFGLPFTEDGESAPKRPRPA